MAISQAVAANPKTRPFVLRKGVSSVLDLADGGGLLMGIGNVYYVCKSTDTTVYADIIAKQRYYPDGSLMIHSTIQSALNATVECRNDYVIVMPSDSDYDLTAALTMSKKAVHLICPAGLGYERGANNAARIEQTTAATAIIAVSDSAVEIAGFYFKPYIGVSHITLAATSYAPNIHHNSFMLKYTTSNAAAILASGDAGAWGGIEHNWFVSQAGDDQTVGSIVSIDASATAARVCYNDFMIGDGNTVTVGVANYATKGAVNYNNFMTAGDDGGFTHCIGLGTWGTAIGNRGTVADSVIVTGGTASYSLSDNMNGASGGAIDEA